MSTLIEPIVESTTSDDLATHEKNNRVYDSPLGNLFNSTSGVRFSYLFNPRLDELSGHVQLPTDSAAQQLKTSLEQTFPGILFSRRENKVIAHDLNNPIHCAVLEEAFKKKYKRQ